MSKNLIVFDIDGTLTDTVITHQQAFIKALQNIGLKAEGHALNEFIHHTDSFIAKEIYRIEQHQEMSEALFEAFSEKLNSLMRQEKIEEIRGSKQLLQYVQASEKLDFVYATGALRNPSIFKLQQLGLPFKEEILVSSDTLVEREQIVSQAIQQAKAFYQTKKYQRIIALGDGVWDLQAAQNLGIDFIGIGEKNRIQMEEKGCNLHFSDPLELMEKGKHLLN